MKRRRVWTLTYYEPDEEGEWKWVEKIECRRLWRLLWSMRPWHIPWAWRVWWRVKSPWGRRALAREIAEFGE